MYRQDSPYSAFTMPQTGRPMSPELAQFIMSLSNLLPRNLMLADRARGINPTTGEAGPWQSYRANPTPESLAPLAGNPQSIIGRPTTILQLKNRYATAISEGRFDEADAYLKQIEALQQPNAIPDNTNFKGGI